MTSGRKIVIDTETTGLDPASGDRVLEVAAIELVNDLPTGRHFRTLINPQRDIPPEATRVHGLTTADVSATPVFAGVASHLAAFLGDAPLIAHNAPFDFGFLDAELVAVGMPPLSRDRMIDTLALAKARFPGMTNNLDALCRRFNIDVSARTTHNALLDCRLLASVYLELTGGRQTGLALPTAGCGRVVAAYAATGARTPRLIVPSAAEIAAHDAFMGGLQGHRKSA